MGVSVEVRRQGGVAGVFASKSFRPGDVVLRLDGRLTRHPSRYSIQVSEDEHLEPDDEASRGASVWRFLNHACTPNLAVDVPNRVLFALRPIEDGDELTFDYDTTEWDMAEPFACRCGAAGCYGTVQGFRHLSPAQRQALFAAAAPHVRALHWAGG